MKGTTVVALVMMCEVLASVAFGAGGVFLVHDEHPWWALAAFSGATAFFVSFCSGTKVQG